MGGQLGISYNDVMAELTNFDENCNLYNLEVVINIREANLALREWCQRTRGEGLEIIARRILSLISSASYCERNWSMYSFVHNKVRNRFGVEKLEYLVYIYTNIRLLHEQPRADPVLWYKNNV